jgi:hypothetical protein
MRWILVAAAVALVGCGGTQVEKDAGVEALVGRDAGLESERLPDGGALCGCGALPCQLEGGGCGECATGADCPGARPICRTETSTCVPCSSGEGDACPAASWCDQGACVPGCGAGADCRSGECSATHDCVNCQADSECGAGRRCGSGVCAPACVTAATCGAGKLCCAGACVDPAIDPLHCSSCLGACAANEFCGNGSCVAAVLANVCRQPVAHAVLDGYPADDGASTSMAQALAATCAPAVALSSGPQELGGLLDATTGEPLRLGELLLVGGGVFGQRSVAWIQSNSVASVTVGGGLANVTFSRPDGSLILSVPWTSLSASHDLFVVQFVRTPYGATMLSAFGYYQWGTVAAAWYVTHTLLPQRAPPLGGWYLVEWTDSDANGLPGEADVWSVRATGG